MRRDLSILVRAYCTTILYRLSTWCSVVFSIMAFVRVCVVVVLTVVLLPCLVSSERMKNKIYDSIEGAAACFRRLNGTHQFGCTSHRLGNVGVIHIIENTQNLTWLLDVGEAVPYMAVLYPSMFTRDVLLKLKSSSKVNGIALINNGTMPHNFTHEDTCPNRFSGLYLLNNQTCDARGEDAWNPYGTKLLMEDWGFPIFYVKKDFDKIEKCYFGFNSEGRNQRHDRSLCAMEMSSFMFATVDSATCIRRSKMITNFNPMRFCDPLGSRNVWSTLFPRTKNTSNEHNSSVYVVASRMDTSSLFDGVTPGAVSPVTGVVALLAAAHTLSQIVKKDKDNHNKNVLFVLFNGESFDYIGSSRMVWDMKRGKFPSEEDENVLEQPPPLHLKHLAYFIELSHLTPHNKDPNSNEPYLTLFPAEKNSVRSHLSKSSFIADMQKIGSSLGLNFKERSDGKIPPASLQTFIAHGDSAPVPGVVIADYDDNFTTRYYHSVFDDNESLEYVYQNGSVPSSDSIQAFVANFSTVLAQTLYKMVTDESYEGPVQADVQLVDELFHCYLEKVNCSVFQNASYNLPLNDEPASLYIGVSTWRGPNYLVTSLTGQTLAYLTGDQVNKTEKECQNNPQQQIYQYIWVKGYNSDGKSGVCIQTTMNYSAAVSPAFEEPDYDWTSGKFSTWTESVWQELSVRVFLKPSRVHEVKIFSIGAVVFGLSFIIVYFLNARSHILFGNTLGTGAC